LARRNFGCGAIAQAERALKWVVASLKYFEAFMYPRRCVASAAAVSIAAVAVLAFLVAPAAAQSPSDLQPGSATSTAKVKKKAAPPTQVAANRPPARVTVRRRSFLDPGTETKTHEEHFQDYAFPPGDNIIGADPNNRALNWTRMPFPSCFDLPGFCRP
jgi:hypothetical protein